MFLACDLTVESVGLMHKHHSSQVDRGKIRGIDATWEPSDRLVLTEPFVASIGTL